jgi:DNA-binding response OmpR family regulator
MPQHTILLVEDDRSIRRYLEVILQRAGYSVTVAADGLEAMRALLASPFDAVVTDAVMPHLDGQGLCGFIRRQPNLSELPVILLSGIEQASPAAHAEQARADVSLSKPVRPEELLAHLARMLKEVKEGKVKKQK